MRIATYNIWNSSRGMPRRGELLIDEVKALDADILALQEVSEDASEMIAKECGYEHHCFATDPYGLAILSRYPITSHRVVDYGLMAMIQCGEDTMLVTDVHLPYDSVLKQEHSMVNIVKMIQGMEADYKWIMGDFNGSDQSSVHRFLKAEQSLHGAEPNPYWTDMAEAYSEKHGTKMGITLDIQTNPRWKNENTVDTGSRVDRIYLKDLFPKPYPVLNDVRMFGTEADPESGYCASDHYGVVADLTMPDC